MFFTAPLTPHDWGIKEVRGQNKHDDGLRVATTLLQRFRPHVVVIENASARGSRRVPRIARLYRALFRHCEREGIPAHGYERGEVRQVFRVVGAITKHEIACTIATLVPALAARLPCKREPWQAEPVSQGIFDAASLGLTFFVLEAHLDLSQAINDEGKDASSLAA